MYLYQNEHHATEKEKTGGSGFLIGVGKDHLNQNDPLVIFAVTNANAEQVQRGWAWVFPRYAPKNSPLYALEREARLDRRGLWADDRPVPPWEWRSMRSGGRSSSAPASAPTKKSGNARRDAAVRRRRSAKEDSAKRDNMTLRAAIARGACLAQNRSWK